MKKKTLKDVGLYGATEQVVRKCFNENEKEMADRRIASIRADSDLLEFVHKSKKEKEKDPFE